MLLCNCLLLVTILVIGRCGMVDVDVVCSVIRTDDVVVTFTIDGVGIVVTTVDVHSY